jgi:DNA-binding transcriptional MerR regulator
MLQWWDEQGIASPTIRGHRREYNETEVRTVEIVQALRERGIGLFKIRKALAQIQGVARDLAELTSSRPKYLLGSHNGRPKATWEVGEADVLEKLAKMGCPVTVVEIR